MGYRRTPWDILDVMGAVWSRKNYLVKTFFRGLLAGARMKLGIIRRYRWIRLEKYYILSIYRKFLAFPYQKLRAENRARNDIAPIYRHREPRRLA